MLASTIVTFIISLLSSLGSTSPTTCRYLPHDISWPSQNTWNQLNETVNGRLIAGIPLGQPCYPPLDDAKCAQVKNEWTTLSTYETNPINIMSPYWQNNSCNPFLRAQNSKTQSTSTCTLGNLASYALNITSISDIITGLQFAQKNNIRLTIKNTGHDFLGRSTGAGSLALWTHNLKSISFLNYTSSFYTGPAVHIGAGVEYADLYPLAKDHGYRVVGGSCAGIGVAGGYTQGGGHGPLLSAYGLGADQVLEWEVVTASGAHLNVSPTEHADLYWALSGGGAGNYAVVFSMTVRAYTDGPVAGAGFSFANRNNDDGIAYWEAVNAWFQTLLVLDSIKDLTTVSTITAQTFVLSYAILPDVTTTEIIDTALSPFFTKLEQLNISLDNSYKSDIYPHFAECYETWVSQAQTSNISLGGRNIPRSTVQNKTTLPALVDAFRNIAKEGGTIFSTAANIAHANYTPNAVSPSWRKALFATAFYAPLAENAGVDDILQVQTTLNTWQEKLRNITPGGGTYMNEATWDNPYWKEDYFGENYEALLAVKEKYDPEFLFWANAAVGSDVYWEVGDRGALCRV